MRGKGPVQANESADADGAYHVYPWHAGQWQQLHNSRAENRLPHAMLLQGSKGLGKHAFANRFAASLLCQSEAGSGHEGEACGCCHACKLLAAGTHPDFYQLKPTASKNSNSKKPLTSIRIDDVRELCAQLAQTSQFSGYRIAVIDVADKMTHEAANSLLKTLEEPGGNVLIMLITAHPARLSATIRSRCQQLRFAEPAADMALAWLKQVTGATYTDDLLVQALKHANGSPLAAIEQLESLELNQLIDQAMLVRGGTGNGSNLIIESAAKLATYDRGRVLDGMLGWVSDAIRIRLGAETGTEGDISSRLVNSSHSTVLQGMVASVSLSRLYWFYDQLQEQRRLESIAINEQLLWENLLLSWNQL